MGRCTITELTDRGVIELASADAEHFLQGLVTNDVTRARDGKAVHAALLTPQGKILFDFLLVGQEDRFLLDCPRAQADELVKRLTFYRLRAKVEITDRSGEMKVCAVWGGTPEASGDAIIFADPRLSELGCRLLVPKDFDLAATGCKMESETTYHAHRISLGVPEGGRDFTYGDSFPHEADFDQLGGVDFDKGCFVGQEVVSRMRHRGTARKRVIPVAGAAPLDTGAEITAGASSIGSIGSVAGNAALAMVRLDRAEKAAGEGKPLESGGVALRLLQPSWAQFTVPGAEGPLQ